MIDTKELCRGDRRVLARAITLLESKRRDDQDRASELVQRLLPHSGNSIRIGLTGVPGAGKSSLIEVLGNHVIEKGHRIAVLAVDSSSSISGGSILGDKTRMETLATNPNAFIRPTPAGSTLGGVARHTRESIVLCEAAGFDVIIVETVGVGQSETLVSEMTDMFLLLLIPGGGDELQGIKRGIMEIADMVVVNKADGDLVSHAHRTAADARQALHLMKPRHSNWQVPVLTASAREQVNVKEIWNKIEKYRRVFRESGELDLQRNHQALNWLWMEASELLLMALKENREAREWIDQVEAQVRNGQVPPSGAARRLVSAFLESKGRDG